MKICMRPWIGRLRFYGAVLSQTKLQNSTTPKIHKNQNYQKLGLGLNFKKYNSSFAPASQQRIKRLNQRRKRKNTRFKQQFDLFWERESQPGRTGPARLPLTNKSDWCLNLVFFLFRRLIISFNSLLACRGERRIIYFEV